MTASLQLQPPPQRRPWGYHDRPAQRSPGGASIERSSAPSFPIRAFSAADRACDVASDVLCRRPRVNPLTIARDRIPTTLGRPTRLRRRLVKGRRLHRIRTPSIDECSLLRHVRFRVCLALARSATGSRGDYRRRGRSPACDEPVSLLACSWFSPLRAGSGAASPAEPPRRESWPARPSCPERQRTMRRSSTSAIQTTREHDHGILRSPLHRASPSVRLRAPPDPAAFAVRNWSLHPAPGLRPEPGFLSVESRLPPRGRGFRLEARSQVASRRLSPKSIPGSCDPERHQKRALRPPTEVSRARGRWLSPSTSPSRAARRQAREGASPQPDPLGHLMSWHRCAAGGRLRSCLRSHRGPHHPCFREEERDPPHPRCLPSMSRLARGSSAEASPPVAERVRPGRTDSHRGSGVIHNLSPRCGQTGCL